MKKTLLFTVGFAALGMAPAVAADLPARTYTKAPPAAAAIYDWTGFYLGFNAGGASSHNCWDLTSAAGNGPIVPSHNEGCHDATGAVAGGQIGYRWQSANWILGVEAQGDWADLTGSNRSLDLHTKANHFFLNSTKIDSIGLFTGQIGYAWNNVLWYLKGGPAVTHAKHNGSVDDISDQASETRWGSAIGTGFEYGFAPSWSVGVEYDHLFMGRHDNTFSGQMSGSGVGITRTDSIKQDVDMATVRLNYRFGDPLVGKF
jgi:outer membrane immunogenic protein